MSPSHIPNIVDRDNASHYIQPDELADYAKGLRELADWLETTEFPLPSTTRFNGHRGFRIAAGWYEDKGFAKRPGAAARLMGGLVKKSVRDWDKAFLLTRNFSGGVHVVLELPRAEVCTPVVAHKEVTRIRPVDGERSSELEREIKRLTEEKAQLDTHVTSELEEVTEYECPPTLLATQQEHEERVAAAKAEREKVSDDIPF